MLWHQRTELELRGRFSTEAFFAKKNFLVNEVALEGRGWKYASRD